MAFMIGNKDQPFSLSLQKLPYYLMFLLSEFNEINKVIRKICSLTYKKMETQYIFYNIYENRKGSSTFLNIK